MTIYLNNFYNGYQISIVTNNFISLPIMCEKACYKETVYLHFCSICIQYIKYINADDKPGKSQMSRVHMKYL